MIVKEKESLAIEINHLSKVRLACCDACSGRGNQIDLILSSVSNLNGPLNLLEALNPIRIV